MKMFKRDINQYIIDQSNNSRHLNVLVLHPRMLYANFVWHWPNGAGAEYENCQEFSRWRRQTTNNFWSDDSYVPSSIGYWEQKNYFQLFAIISLCVALHWQLWRLDMNKINIFMRDIIQCTTNQSYIICVHLNLLHRRILWAKLNEIGPVDLEKRVKMKMSKVFDDDNEDNDEERQRTNFNQESWLEPSWSALERKFTGLFINSFIHKISL